jgi:protein transport protein SEC23
MKQRIEATTGAPASYCTPLPVALSPTPSFPSEPGPASEAVRSSRGQPGGSGRILVCAAGPVTQGPGAIPCHAGHPSFEYAVQQARQHMAGLARQAKQLEVAIDVLCAGTCPVHVPVVHPLAEGSGGVLLLLADGFQATFAENVRRALLRGSGSRGSLAVRCSPPLQLARIIGPAEAPTEALEQAGPIGEGSESGRGAGV